MKSTKLLLTTVSLLFILVYFLSCKKDKNDEPTTTTVAEDRQNIQLTFDNTLDGIIQIRDSEFFQTLVRFLNLQDGNVLHKEWVNNLYFELDTVANLSWIDQQNRFSPYYFRGIYDWNYSTISWDKTSNNDFILNFPSDKFVSSNDVQFILTEYTDASYTIFNEAYYLPTKIKARLTSNGMELFNINMSAIYSSTGFPVPTDAMIDLFFKNYNYSIKIKKITNTQFEIDVDFLVESENEINFYVKLSLAHDDYENLNIEQDLNTIQFDITKENMNINGSWDVKTYNSLSHPTTDQLNNTIFITINYKDQKIGDLRFKDIGDEKELFIFYKDGNSENTSIYTDPFINDLKAELKPYFGELNFKKINKNGWAKWEIKNLITEINEWFN